MAFLKSFQQNLPSVNISSIFDSVTSRVDDLANAVSDVTYAVSDQLTEQVTTIISKVQEDEDGENGGGQDPGQASAAQEGKAGNKSMWQMNRDSDAGNNQASDTTEAENHSSQLEWEWRDGCWRVKKTEAELAEEEKKKKEEKELQEQREQRRRERREKQLEREAKRSKEEGQLEGDDALEKTGEGGGQDREASDGGEESAARQGRDGCDETAGSPGCESKPKEREQRDDGGEKEEVEDDPEREGDNEEEGELSRSPSKTKKKKSTKKKGKGAKEGQKKSEKAADEGKKKEKGKKGSKKKKKKGNPDGVVSDSEEDRGPEAGAQQNATSTWSKAPAEQGGYSSEASSERANSIQRIKKDSSLSELQPPPYQDEGSGARVSSRPRSERGVRRASSPQRCESPRCSSEASGEEQDTESYLNKGCEEDIPSDSTAVLGPEDGSGPQLPTAYEPEPFAKYGTLDVAFEYDSSEQWLAVTVTAATDIPALKQTGNISWQVHLVLLPTKKQRAKTGVQKGPCPVFTETFKFSRVEQEALGDYAVRFRLYSIRRMKKEKVLGEKVFYLTKLNLQGKIALPVTLEPGSELAGCGSLVSVSRSAGAVSYRSTEDSSMPEILLGLIYNSATGQLSAEVIQGSHFKTAASEKPVNTYVKLTMLDSKGKEMSKCKTAVCRGQPNPTYKETFVFQVALFQLSEVSLVLSVFCRRSSMRPRERLGWVSLGLNSTSEEQQQHWSEMKEAEGQQVCHWHTLTDT
ncbi:synaptotagmin-14b isoform X2 [Mugil cephalus]|uniref:synaptotagmin-14b isoform X2 n=1 Tax=Mugil cephalus TaxID=48193 RepID=UPI001FB839DB|nr:synaptotagmin-14b isoform X2 [Mugil cephalus]